MVILRFRIIANLEGKFEEAVIAYLFIVNVFPIIIVPLMWYENRNVANVLNSWTEFEQLYARVAGQQLRLNLRTKALMVAVLLPLLSTLSVIITHVTMVDFNIDQVVPYCFLDTLIYMMGAYWYMCCETLSQSALILAEDFQKVKNEISQTPKSTRIYFRHCVTLDQRK